MTDSELIHNYIEKYAMYLLRYETGKDYSKLKETLDRYNKEILARGIMTAEQLDTLF